MTRVLIIGGGIGGLTLAQKLQQAEMPVQVFERRAEAGDWLQGFRVRINEYGSHALRQCLPPALWEAFTATAGQPGLGMAFQTEQLDEMLFVEEDLMTDPVDRSYAVSRITLRRLLLAGLENVHFGRTFERYEVNGEEVTAHFADGSSATGDVLIGADGANSVVRGQLLPHAHRVLTDVIGVAGRVPLNDETRAWLPRRIQSGMNIILPRSPSFLFSAVFDGRRRTTDAFGSGLDLSPYGLTPEVLLDDLQDYVLWAYGTRRLPEGGAEEAVRRWHPDLRRLIAESDPASVNTIPFKTSTPARPWQTTRVTLLGDAIHNMTPVMGLGANTALRDAALLAHQLIQGGDLLPALAEYERRMLSYGFEAVERSRSSAYRFTSGNPLARMGARTWLRMCARRPAMKQAAFASTRTDDLAAL